MPLKRISGIFFSRPTLFIVGAVAGALALAGIAAMVLYEMRMDALGRARDGAENLALILQRDIERNLEVYELSIDAVVDGVSDPATLRLPAGIRQRVLFDRSTHARDMGTLLVADRTGEVVFDSAGYPPRRRNLAEEDYFTVHQRAAGAGLFISRPFVPGAQAADQAIALSRRLAGPHGDFAGAVVGTLRLNYFHRLFDGMTLGDHGSLTLLRSDGTVLMRRPYSVSEIGRSIAAAASFKPLLLASSGSFIGTAALDGERRLYSFRHIGTPPLIIVVGLSTQDIYAEWRRRAWAIGMVVALLDAFFIAISVLFASQLRQRLAMEAQLHRLASTDGLTGVGTRRLLDETLDTAWRAARRQRQRMSLLMVDADRFKSFNDRFGHAAGDAALRAIAQCIAASARRPGDFVGRYGGEEFCVLLPGTGLDDAIRVAERIRAAVQAIDPAALGAGEDRLSVSIGVASFDGVTQRYRSRQELLLAADHRLYEAKAGGRNTVRPATAAATPAATPAAGGGAAHPFTERG